MKTGENREGYYPRLSFGELPRENKLWKPNIGKNWILNKFGQNYHCRPLSARGDGGLTPPKSHLKDLICLIFSTPAQSTLVVQSTVYLEPNPRPSWSGTHLPAIWSPQLLWQAPAGNFEKYETCPNNLQLMLSRDQ